MNEIAPSSTYPVCEIKWWRWGESEYSAALKTRNLLIFPEALQDGKSPDSGETGFAEVSAFGPA